MIPERYAHQQAIVDFCGAQPRVLDFTDPGCGKTRAHLDAYAARSNRKRALVLAPLSILEPAWGADIRTFQPSLTYAIADAKHRERALRSEADIVIANHDGIKQIAALHKRDRGVLAEFDTLIVDEADAYKNLAGRGGSARAQALAEIRHLFPQRELLTGTPVDGSVLDLWALAFICDDGQRLGKSYFGFRNQVTTPEQVGPSAQMIRWVDKPGALDMTTKLLQDITIRFEKSKCVDIPKNHVFTVTTKLPPTIQKAYDQLAKESALLLASGAVINAIHAGARAQKLLQMCTGAIYDGDSVAQIVHLDRYRLVLDLANSRPWPCVIVFNWRHEREQLVQMSQSDGRTYAVIDGETPPTARPGIVAAFQRGEIKNLFVHPQSAGHGLTLTAGRTTIWSSPNSVGRLFVQVNARIDRNGQQHETETILIAAENTRETHVYDMLQGKVARMTSLLDLIVGLQEAA